MICRVSLLVVDSLESETRWKKASNKSLGVDYVSRLPKKGLRAVLGVPYSALTTSPKNPKSVPVNKKGYER